MVMKNESLLRRLTRNLIAADYKSDDTVPFIGSREFGDIFAPQDTVREIERMSKVGRFFLYIWFIFIVFIMLVLLFAGVAVVMYPQGTQNLNFFMGMFFVLLELFVLIQGLSVLAYFRWRIKQRLHKR